MLDHNSEKQSFINDKLIGRTIEVTAEDIRNGVSNTATKCAVALSINNALTNSLVAYVGTRETNIVYLKGQCDEIDNMLIDVVHEKRVTSWIESFDIGESSPVELTFVKDDDGHFDVKMVVK
jgi:hypothetical protein